MNIVVREFNDHDKALLQTFIEKLQDFVVATDPIQRIRRLPGFGTHRLNETLEMLQKNQGKIYFAENDGKQIGYIFGFVCDKQSKENLLEVIPTQVGQIEDLYIEPAYRKDIQFLERGNNYGQLY